MPLEIPVGFAHVAIEHRHVADPEPWYITFGVDVGDAGGDVQVIGNKCWNSYFNAFNDALSNQVTVTGVEVTLATEDSEPIRAFVNAPSAGVGSATNEKLPQNCALLIRKNSNLGGRRNRGRMFLPGVLQEGNTNAVGVIDQGTVTIFQGYATAFFAELGDDVNNPPALPMVILHSTGISTVPVPTPVTSMTVDQIISTQRRRLR